MTWFHRKQQPPLALTAVVSRPVTADDDTAPLFPALGDPFEDLSATRDVQTVTNLRPVPMPVIPAIPAAIRVTSREVARNTATTLLGVARRAVESPMINQLRAKVNETWATLRQFMEAAWANYTRMCQENDARLDRMDARLDVAFANVRGDVPALTKALSHATVLHAVTLDAAAYLISQHVPA